MAVRDPLCSAEPPWVHLVVLPAGKAARSALGAPADYVVRAIDGRRCRTKRGFLAEAARALEFPSGSGRNWDAFEELLADLDWLPGKGYRLIVTDAHELLAELPEDYDTFIEIAQTVAKEWAAPRRGESARPAVPFHVCLLVPRAHEDSRDWRVPRLAIERRTG